MLEGGFKNEPALFFGKLPANAVPLVKPLLRLLILLSGLLALEAHAAPAARQVLAEAALTDDDTRRRELIVGLAGSGDPAIAGLVTDGDCASGLPRAHLDDIPAVAAMMLTLALPLADALERLEAEG